MEFSPDAKRAFHVQTYGAATAIDGVRVVELTRHADDSGAMTELARLAPAPDPPRRRPRRAQPRGGDGTHRLSHRPALLARAGDVRRGSAPVGLRRQGRLGDHAGLG